MRANKLCGFPGFLHPASDVKSAFNIELKPCPFCGGVPALYDSYSPHITCTSCAADGPAVERDKVYPEKSRFEAAIAWNKRHGK